MAQTRYEATANVLLTFVSTFALIASTALVAAAIALNTDRSCDSITIGPNEGGDYHWQLPQKTKTQPKKEKVRCS